MKYTEYKEKLLHNLVERAKQITPDLKPGNWSRTGESKDHILPIIGNNTITNKINAIKRYLKFDVPITKGLHQYAHHLNSSQLLCLMFFTPLIEDHKKGGESLVKFIYDAFGITISQNAKCDFEYTQKYEPYIFMVDGKSEYEGTSFDFYIKDGEVEVFFEIKLSEQGFGKADCDSKHCQKAEQYIKLLPENMSISTNDLLSQYQIIRNVIRATAPNKYVVFITDESNPATNGEIHNIPLSSNVIHKTWQNIRKYYPLKVPFQIESIWDEDTSSI